MQIFIRKNIKWFISLIFLFIFLFLVSVILKKEQFLYDTMIYEFISNYFLSDKITPLIKIITNLGGIVSLLSLTLASLIFLKDKKIGFGIALNLSLITILNHVLKFIIARPRPVDINLILENGYSFPSGHAMICAAYYGFFIYLIYSYIKSKYIKWTLISLILFLIFLIGFSRIYLGVHYMSDVLAGFSLSVVYLTIYSKFFNQYIVK